MLDYMMNENVGCDELSLELSVEDLPLDYLSNLLLTTEHMTIEELPILHGTRVA